MMGKTKFKSVVVLHHVLKSATHVESKKPELKNPDKSGTTFYNILIFFLSA